MDTPKRGRAVKYTRELVAPLAAASQSYYDLAIALGLGWKGSDVTRPVVRALVRKLGVDVSHLPRKPIGVDYPEVSPTIRDTPSAFLARRRKARVSRYTVEFLEPLIQAGKSLEEITWEVGGTSQATTRGALLKLGLPLPVEPPAVSVPRKPMAPRKYTREVVEPLVKLCTNFYDLARALGMNMKHYTMARDVTRRLDLDTSHFTRKPYVCTPERYGSLGRLGMGAPWQEVLVLRPVGADTNGQGLCRALIDSGREYKCAVCGLPPVWNGTALRLQVDHIDGVGWDDRAENLRFICPNCHAQTHTFCGKNIHNLQGRGAPKKKRGGRSKFSALLTELSSDPMPPDTNNQTSADRGASRRCLLGA